MIRSMTGFGSAAREVDGASYAIELRSVNGRYYKAQVRLPEELAGLESALEQRLAKRIARGSLTVTVRFVDASASAAATVSLPALERYLDQLGTLTAVRDGRVGLDAGTLLQLPGVLAPDGGEARRSQALEVLSALLDDAVDALELMRLREGETLLADLLVHAEAIEAALVEVRELAPRVVDAYQERLRTRMAQLLEETGGTVRDEDLLREVAVMAERTDISEELSRLEGHLAQYRELLSGDEGAPVGRTLDFLAQEMLREANTIGSKCLDGDVARRIVEVKGAIDRIKEQVQNVA